MSAHIQQMVPTFTPRDDHDFSDAGGYASGRIYQPRNVAGPSPLQSWTHRITALRLSVGLNLALVLLVAGMIHPF